MSAVIWVIGTALMFFGWLQTDQRWHDRLLAAGVLCLLTALIM